MAKKLISNHELLQTVTFVIIGRKLPLPRPFEEAEK